MTQTMNEARAVAEHWLTGPQLSVLGDGHIHDTFLAEAAGQRLVLQRINEFVFRDAEQLMQQTQRLLTCWSTQTDYVCPELQPTHGGADYLRTETGLWRAWSFLPGRTIDPPERPAQAYATGLAFARFQTALSALPEPKLAPTIERFLNLDHYLDEYDSVANTVEDRWRFVVDGNRHLTEMLGPTQAHIHGDCKIDNLLFNQAATEVQAVLDFDTAMYAPRALDFGDLVRSISASMGAFDIEMYAQSLAGFLDGGVKLTPQEAVSAPSYVTFMLGVRFLTDHVRGDVYFKTASPGENLARAERQFELLDALGTQHQALAACAQRLCSTG